MSAKKNGPTTIAVEPDKISHNLRSALNNFRESFEMLQESNPDIIGAKTVFASAENRLLELISFFSAKS